MESQSGLRGKEVLTPVLLHARGCYENVIVDTAHTPLVAFSFRLLNARGSPRRGILWHKGPIFPTPFYTQGTNMEMWPQYLLLLPLENISEDKCTQRRAHTQKATHNKIHNAMLEDFTLYVYEMLIVSKIQHSNSWLYIN